MKKGNYKGNVYSSARSRRTTAIHYAPPFLIFGLFGLSILLQIPAGYVMHNYSFFVGMVLNQIMALLVPALLAIKVFHLTWGGVLPFKKPRLKEVLVTSLMILSVAVITDYLIYLTELLLPISETLAEAYERFMKVRGVGSYLYLFSLLCLFPGFCEEIFFRGFCQTGFASSYGKKWGLVLSALLFAVAHLNPWYLHLYFLLGLILSWLFLTTGNLWIPIIGHIVNNWWTFTIHVAGVKFPVADQPEVNWIIVSLSAILFLVSIYLYKFKITKPSSC